MAMLCSASLAAQMQPSDPSSAHLARCPQQPCKAHHWASLQPLLARLFSTEVPCPPSCSCPPPCCPGLLQIRAAKEVIGDSDFFLVARTDVRATSAKNGLNEAITRANVYIVSWALQYLPWFGGVSLGSAGAAHGLGRCAQRLLDRLAQPAGCFFCQSGGSASPRMAPGQLLS